MSPGARDTTRSVGRPGADTASSRCWASRGPGESLIERLESGIASLYLARWRPVSSEPDHAIAMTMPRHVPVWRAEREADHPEAGRGDHRCFLQATQLARCGERDHWMICLGHVEIGVRDSGMPGLIGGVISDARLLMRTRFIMRLP